MTLNDATISQNTAADPGVSTWLSANAGSGKTRVLTDRVARLLLRGTDPQNILCLTYTKAAAGEMQNRLFKGLGEWSMLPDAQLKEALSEIGETQPKDLSHARTLFAQAVETPGGLKIQTIHSFCSALLRQFPLEAGVSPGFRELDEAGQTEVIEQVLDDLVTTYPEPVADIARLYSGESLVKLAGSVISARTRFGDGYEKSDIRSIFGIDKELTISDILANTIFAEDLAFLRSVGTSLVLEGSKTDQKLGHILSALPETPSRGVLEILEKVMLFGESAQQPFGPKTGTIPTKSVREGIFAPHLQRFETIMEAVGAARKQRIALDAADHSHALHIFAKALLPAYARAKTERGVLDFDDLIESAKSLLSDRSLAWVLYRLDGRIDHILVDEAQDTSPAQWSVIGALAEELASGEGSQHAQPRSLFVVGDKKQSIYSFQGADARAFDRMKDHFGSRMSHGLVPHELLYSFRSSPAILDVVDATFGDETDTALGSNVRHRAFHPEFPGRVDLWPLQEREDTAETPPWYDPVDRVSGGDPAVLLADKLAEKIADLLKNGTIQGKDGTPRSINAGDILILVQRRSELFDQIIRACKACHLPIAGADRLKINAALAVKDLTALLSFLALPEDDLSLAAALRSPLFCWSEQELFSLASERGGNFLWQELRDRKAEYPETHRILNDLRSRADYDRPFELLERMLGTFHGRRNLVARLGPEAEDGIDELLAHALRFEQRSVPTLTGFLAQLSAEELEIKRATDTSLELIRVMTIHGAKGLEAPIVILPDTIRQKPSATGDFVMTPDGLPLWNEPTPKAPEIVRVAKEIEAAAATEERLRLLYVAMTRAESWLIVAGIKPANPPKITQWHEMVESGLTKVGASWLTEDDARILRYERGAWPDADAAVEKGAGSSDGSGPEIATFGKIPAAPRPMPTVAPSDLGGAKALAGEGGLDEEAAMARGRAIHALLEHLPEHSRQIWPSVTERLLAGEVSNAGQEKLLHEVATCIDTHTDVFAASAMAEVDITADLPTLDKKLDGTVDRVVFRDGSVTIVDYKTNAVRPHTASGTPDGILRQMGAYLEAAKAIWPDRDIKLKILWTVDAHLMELSHDLVIDAFSRVARS